MILFQRNHPVQRCLPKRWPSCALIAGDGILSSFFGLWFSLASFLVRPFLNVLSRRHAADAFALANGTRPEDLGAALKKLRE